MAAHTASLNVVGFVFLLGAQPWDSMDDVELGFAGTAPPPKDAFCFRNRSGPAHKSSTYVTTQETAIGDAAFLTRIHYVILSVMMMTMMMTMIMITMRTKDRDMSSLRVGLLVHCNLHYNIFHYVKFNSRDLMMTMMISVHS
jgi:hypothetical protein